MNTGSINLDKLSVDIDSMVMDIKSNYFEDANNGGISIPESVIDAKEFDSVCKFFGCQADNMVGGR